MNIKVYGDRRQSLDMVQIYLVKHRESLRAMENERRNKLKRSSIDEK